MWNCLFFRKDLYQYAEGVLDLDKEKKIKNHLSRCSICGQRLKEMRKVLAAIEKTEEPFLGEVFWRKFDERLNLKIPQEKIRTSKYEVIVPKFKPLPKFGLAVAVSVCILLIVIGLPLRNYLFMPSATFVNDQELVETTLLLEEEEGLSFNHDEDAYLEEMLLQMELERV